MSKFFENVMIPVFSTYELEANGDKVIEIAKLFHCHIHLFYISLNGKSSILKKTEQFLSNRKRSLTLSETKMVELYRMRFMQLCPSLSFYSSATIKNSNQDMIDYYHRNNIQLVIFLGSMQDWGERNEKLNMSWLADKMGCPVINFNNKTQIFDIKNIVIPIGSTLPMKRLMVGSYIGKLFNSRIHLVSLNKKFLVNGRDEAVGLYRAYHLLRDITNLPVECITLMAKNMEEASFQYAEQIGADAVFVDSGNEPTYLETMS
jgi:hypothetical protein